MLTAPISIYNSIIPFLFKYLGKISLRPDVNLTAQKIVGLLITETNTSRPVIDEENKKIINTFENYFDLFFITDYSQVGHIGYDIERLLLPVKIEVDGTTRELTNKEAKHMMTYVREGNVNKFLRDFLVNFCLFINQPDIEFVHYEAKPSKTDKHGKVLKTAIAEYKFIRLTGELKRYVDNISQHLGSHFHYKFWVRGHWRTYKDEKYKEMRGKVQWIKPYIKGEGMLIDKEYVLSKDKLSDKENMFFEDVKPLTKSLVEMSDRERAATKAKIYREQKKENSQ